MAERTADPTPPADPEIAGVALSAYAAVLAYVAEGVPLEQSLEHAAIPVAAWPQVEATWSARLAESAMEDGALVEACDQHRLAAQAHVDRKLPPLDTELRAWLDFFRAFTAAEDPLGFLEARGLGEGDVFRLLGFWHERIAADEEVRNEATALLAAAPGPAPEVRPEPPTLKAPTRKPRRAAKGQTKQRTASVALSETTQALSNISEPILPFLQPVSAPAVSPPLRRVRRWSGGGSTSRRRWRSRARSRRRSPSLAERRARASAALRRPRIRHYRRPRAPRRAPSSRPRARSSLSRSRRFRSLSPRPRRPRAPRRAPSSRPRARSSPSRSRRFELPLRRNCSYILLGHSTQPTRAHPYLERDVVNHELGHALHYGLWLASGPLGERLSTAANEAFADILAHVFDGDPCHGKVLDEGGTPVDCRRRMDGYERSVSDAFWGFGRADHETGQSLRQLIWTLREEVPADALRAAIVDGIAAVQIALNQIDAEPLANVPIFDDEILATRYRFVREYDAASAFFRAVCARLGDAPPACGEHAQRIGDPRLAMREAWLANAPTSIGRSGVTLADGRRVAFELESALIRQMTVTLADGEQRSYPGDPDLGFPEAEREPTSGRITLWFPEPGSTAPDAMVGWTSDGELIAR
ncbi:hypothetical protein WME98_08050 [Sorangium sp. So ce296]|uniref:hypothetical protein n=1 Tax=Sorangium sp. So ce296 TaxID=3133296 RepID=UPI003F5FCCAF